jgi:hypothetical protein
MAPPTEFPTTNLIDLPLKNSSEAAFEWPWIRAKPDRKNAQIIVLFINSPS